MPYRVSHFDEDDLIWKHFQDCDTSQEADQIVTAWRSDGFIMKSDFVSDTDSEAGKPSLYTDWIRLGDVVPAALTNRELGHGTS